MKHVVTPDNWRQYGSRIHQEAMKKMEITPGSLDEAIFLTLAASGEMGELANVVKKMWRDGQNADLSEKLTEELADVFIYLDHLVQLFQLQPSHICAKKLQALTERWPDYFKDWAPVGAMVQ